MRKIFKPLIEGVIGATGIDFTGSIKLNFVWLDWQKRDGGGQRATLTNAGKACFHHPLMGREESNILGGSSLTGNGGSFPSMTRQCN